MFLIFFLLLYTFSHRSLFCDSIFAFTFLWTLIPCIAIHKLGWLQNVNWKKKEATMKLNTKPLEMGKYRSETSISFYINMYAIITTTHFYTYIFPGCCCGCFFLSFFSFGNSLWINTTWNCCREYTNECNIYQQKRLKQRINKLCSLNSMHGNNDGREKKEPEKETINRYNILWWTKHPAAANLYIFLNERWNRSIITVVSVYK